jgi:hypothetical protein
MKLSYAICACTEDRELASLLNFLLKVKDAEDEIVVLLDKDRTTPHVRRVLAEFGTSVVHHERVFDGNFSTHRNYHNSLCTGDFIFVIDADEMPTEVLIKNIKNIIHDNKNCEMVALPRVNICPGYTEEWLKKGTFTINDMGWINWPDWQGRIFKNAPHIKWSKNLHERVEGYKGGLQLIDNPKVALWHIKSVEKQDYQGAFYDNLV